VGIAGRGDEHLEILSQIAILFSDEDEVEKLKQAQSPEELFALLSAVNDS
jgi:PTS system mannitol-specific IIA component